MIRLLFGGQVGDTKYGWQSEQTTRTALAAVGRRQIVEDDFCAQIQMEIEMAKPRILARHPTIRDAVQNTKGTVRPATPRGVLTFRKVIKPAPVGVVDFANQQVVGLLEQILPGTDVRQKGKSPDG